MPPEVIGIELGLLYLAIAYTVSVLCEKRLNVKLGNSWLIGFAWPFILLLVVILNGSLVLFSPVVCILFVISKIIS